MAEKKVMKLASRGKRFGAFCIDMVVPFFVYIVFFAIMAAAGINPYEHGYGYGYGYGFGYGYGYDPGFDYGSRLSTAEAAVIILIALLLIVYFVVECIFYAKGKSIGKAITGLQVVSSKNGKPFTFWPMMLRECIVKQASGVLLLGYIWVLIDDKNRAWHDKILDTYVVDLRESEKMNLARKAASANAAPAPAPVKAEEAPTVKDEAAVAAAAATEAKPVVVEPIEEAAPAEAGDEVSVETAVEAAAETAADAPAETPELSMSMKKAELIEAAAKAGVKVSSRATKEEIIEAVRKASEK